MITRRFLLGSLLTAATLAGAGRAARADGAMRAWSLDPAGTDTVSVRGPGGVRGILLPARRARIIDVLPVAGHDIAAIAFAADRDGAGDLDLLALVGSDAVEPRILGLEVLSWVGGDGSALYSRIGVDHNGRGVRIERSAQRARDSAPEAWTDLLFWRARAPLEDGAVHLAAPGSCQAIVYAMRSRVTDMLDLPCRSVTPKLVAAVDVWRTLPQAPSTRVAAAGL